MRIIFFSTIIIFLLAQSCVSKKNVEINDKEYCKHYFDTIVNMDVYKFVDSPPYFEKGNADVLKYFNEHYNTFDSLSNQLTYLLEFVVDIDGSIIGGRIRNKSRNQYSGSEMEVINIFESMPKWVPGKCKENNVPVLVNFPIKL